MSEQSEQSPTSSWTMGDETVLLERLQSLVTHMGLKTVLTTIDDVKHICSK